MNNYHISQEPRRSSMNNFGYYMNSKKSITNSSDTLSVNDDIECIRTASPYHGNAREAFNDPAENRQV